MPVIRLVGSWDTRRWPRMQRRRRRQSFLPRPAREGSQYKAAHPRPTGRRTQIRINSLQGAPIAVSGLYQVLAPLLRRFSTGPRLALRFFVSGVFLPRTPAHTRHRTGSREGAARVRSAGASDEITIAFYFWQLIVHCAIEKTNLSGGPAAPRGRAAFNPVQVHQGAPGRWADTAEQTPICRFGPPRDGRNAQGKGVRSHRNRSDRTERPGYSVPLVKAICK